MMTKRTVKKMTHFQLTKNSLAPLDIVMQDVQVAQQLMQIRTLAGSNTTNMVWSTGSAIWQPPATTGNQGTQRTKQSDESSPGSIVHEITTKKF
jgi:hypothetical protein